MVASRARSTSNRSSTRQHGAIFLANGPAGLQTAIDGDQRGHGLRLSGPVHAGLRL